jgi:hypothetical protein
MNNTLRAYKTLSLTEIAAAREEVALRMEEARNHASEVADLCARAAEAGHNVPHAGMGSVQNVSKTEAEAS